MIRFSIKIQYMDVLNAEITTYLIETINVFLFT